MAIRCLRAPAFAIIVLAGIVAAGPSALAATGDCDRACLRGMLDQYLGAVVKHDPSAAPLFVGFRQTENAAVIRRGDGLWKSVTGLGKLQRYYLDPEDASAGYFGTLEEGSTTSMATLRLKITNRKISEAEWIIARPDTTTLVAGRGGAMNAEALAKNPPREAPVPKGARSSRDGMIAAANSYFDGLQAHDGSIVLAHPGCFRVENGVTVTGGGGGTAVTALPAAAPTGAAAGSQAVGALSVSGDCTSNFQGMTMVSVAARRFPVVDEEAGVILGMAVFIRAPGSPQKRNLLTEWFTIDNDKIRGIHAAMFYPDSLTAVPNWPPYDGNYPLGLTVAPGR